MAGLTFTTRSSPIAHKVLSSGLNSTAGELALEDSESSDLQNIDFDIFGSISKRKGYTALNSSAISGTPDIDGLWWYEYDSAGVSTRKAISVASDKIYKMDDLDGTWDDISGSVTITAGNHVDFSNFLNEVYMTNGVDLPFKWDGTGNAEDMTVPSGLTTAKFNEEFNNYLFLGNVTVSGTAHPSRIYWSNLKDTDTWTATDFIEISKNDGEAITGLKVLADRLVVYKERSIYSVYFTGDADIPFVLPGGGKSNSAVGCIAPFSIQNVDNGQVFLSSDGLYFFDGANSFKISDRVTNTISGYNQTRLDKAVSLNYRKKNIYMVSFTTSGSSENDRILVWNYALNSFSVYVGMAPSSMAIFNASGQDERPYFGDYNGYVYRMDIGNSDYPLNVSTAINAYYYTNWKSYEDLVDQKGVSQVYIYYTINDATITFAYSTEFNDDDDISLSFSTSTSADVYGTAVYGTGTYAKAGGDIKRFDLTRRGRVIRFKFANSVDGETFRINGFGSLPHLETNT